MKRKLSYTNQFGTYTAEVDEDLETMSAVLAKLVAPVLFAAGYSYKTVEKAIHYEECLENSTEGIQSIDLGDEESFFEEFDTKIGGTCSEGED